MSDDRIRPFSERWRDPNFDPQYDDPDFPQRETFDVWQFFEDGSHERVRDGVGAEEAVAAARHYTSNVAAKLGITQRVIITDNGDDCVFEWKRGEGVTFPEECRGRQ